MDISSLATKKNADEGKWFRVDLYGKDWNLWLNILGDDADAVQEHQKKQFKKMNANVGKTKTLDNKAIDDLFDSDIENVLVRINGIAGGDEKPDTKDEVVLFEHVLSDDESSYRYMLEQIPALKKWILEKSKERLNFLS